MSFAIKTLVEILRRVLGGYDTDLEDKIIPGGSNPGDRPPLIKRPDTNPTELRDLTPRDPTRYLVRISREVVIWRKRDFARPVEEKGEVAGGFVDVVVLDGEREEPYRKTMARELRVGPARCFDFWDWIL